MCMYNLTLNDELVRQTRQTFANDVVMTLWLQKQVEALMIDRNAQQQAIKQRARAAVEAMRNISMQNGNADMSLEDINREIQQARQARRATV